ncbi:MarR family winged helix-turn-helix transcriptional regulator [Clostridium sp. BJN0013]|uniref:MarR family winged helix-turn-helix transcriptional regulator n=1 Tax=Clostridium sp. BJN0013 TaxID=3236840 RepID=UPI0034C69D12
MSIDKVKELNDLWHIVGMRMKAEMNSGKYPAILGVSMVELSILQVVENRPNCMLKEISSQLELPKSTLTSAINRLESKGLVKRNLCKEDKRAYNLELTEVGLQAQHEHRNIEYAIFEDMLQKLDMEEKNIFIRMLSKAVSSKRNENENY